MTTPIIPEETEGQLYTRLGIDGRAWAEKMGKRFNVSMEEFLPWTCSMIMAAYDKDRHPKQPTTNPHTLAMEEALSALDAAFGAVEYCQRSFTVIRQQIEGKGLRLSNEDIAAELGESLSDIKAAIVSLTKALGR